MNKQILISLVYLLLLPVFFFAACENDSRISSKDREINAFLSSKRFEVPRKSVYLSNFEYNLLNGGKENLLGNRDQIILLNFWATWCLPCKREMPDLEELNSLMKGEKFRILAINTGDDRKKVTRFTRKFSYSFDVALDERKILSSRLKVYGLPTTYIFKQERKSSGKSSRACRLERNLPWWTFLNESAVFSIWRSIMFNMGMAEMIIIGAIALNCLRTEKNAGYHPGHRQGG